MKISKDMEEILEAVIRSDQEVYFVASPVCIADGTHRYLTREDIMDILAALGGDGQIVILDKGEKLEDTRVMVQGAPADEPTGWEEENETLHNT